MVRGVLYPVVQHLSGLADVHPRAGVVEVAQQDRLRPEGVHLRSECPSRRR